MSLGVDLIVAVEDEAIRAAANATRTIPIVMLLSPDPIGQGFAESLGHPGGNVTGLSTRSAELNPKRLEYLVETVPGLSRVAVVWVSRADTSPDLQALQDAARDLKVQLDVLPQLPTAGVAVANALASIAASRPQALFVLTDAFASSYQPNRARVVDLARSAGLPAVYESRAFVTEGGLMAYGPNLPENFRRAAAYVDKILKGARPADLPIEQPREFEFVINRKTAEALGLWPLPESVLQSVLQAVNETIQ